MKISMVILFSVVSFIFWVFAFYGVYATIFWK